MTRGPEPMPSATAATAIAAEALATAKPTTRPYLRGKFPLRCCTPNPACCSTCWRRSENWPALR
jgi:hypothetical protein